MKHIGSLLACATLLFIMSPCFADVESNFTSGDENWKVGTTLGGTYTPVWDPAGYIYTSDPDGETTYWVAPEKFRGPKAWCYNKELNFQELAVPDPGSTPLDPTAAALVGILGGNGIWLSYFSSVAPTSIHDFVIPITAGSTYGWHKGTSSGDPWATYTDMINVLGNISGIYLKAEYYSGPETNYLDNVILTPEPSSLLCLLGGLAGLAGLRRKKT